jgi:DNA-binding response OmpR family regulator
VVKFRKIYPGNFFVDKKNQNQMKTISLSVELASIALETIGKPFTPSELLLKVKKVLNHRTDLLGAYTGSRLSSRKSLGSDLSLNEYRLDFEKSSVLFQLARFNPRGEWQVQGFRFV